MAKQSLFSILARQPWWVSVVIATALFAGIRLVLPEIIAVAAAVPFLGILGYVAWRGMRAPGVSNIAATLEKLRGMSWETFSAIIQEAFERDGYEVVRISEGVIDLELRKNGLVTVVTCKRWKVAQTGIGPLRDLVEGRKARDAVGCIYVSAGEFTGQARKFAVEKSVQLLNDAALGMLISRVGRSNRRWLFWK